MSRSLSATKGMDNSLCSSPSSWHLMGPRGELIQCPNQSEDYSGFADGLISCQLGALEEPTGPVAEVVGGSCGLILLNTLRSFCVEFGNLWKGVVLLPPAVILCPSGEEGHSIMERLGNVESAQGHLE